MLIKIKNKFIGVVILNALDILITLYLVGTGICIEANAIIGKILNYPILSMVIKIFVPMILLYFLYQHMKKATEKQLRISNIMVNIILGFYIFVVVNNSIWLSMSIIFGI